MARDTYDVQPMEDRPHTRSRTSTGDAYALHESVPPDRWCVTWKNLEYLRKEVKDALLKEEIHPNDRDPFQRYDRIYGPSIYTVTEQHIKPVTRDAGKMSWALMLNPRGLGCDLFISHAWAEGIFEFLRKVRHSWPRGARHAWCCMLANPQNLNIGALLQSPSSSPFALALHSANVVLVVPNRHCSIYTRLWCAYEGYLAQEAGKPILVARTSSLPRFMSSMKYLCASAAFGCLLGMLVRAWGLRLDRYLWLVSVAAMLGTTITDNKSRIVMHCLCEMICFIELVDTAGFPTGEVWGFPDEMHSLVHIWFWLMAGAFFCLQEVDRIEGGINIKEAQQLRAGYQGSIQYAECSESSDAEKILSEIGPDCAVVDFAIQVLLTAGMSTTALRDIARAGVDIHNAAYSEITAAVTILGPFDLLTFSHLIFELCYESGELIVSVLQFLSIFFRIIIMIVLCRSEIDDIYFVLKVLTKAVGLLLMLLLLVCFIAISTKRSPLLAWLILLDLVLGFAVILCILGIKNTAQMPFGLRILQVFFARGTTVFSACKKEPVQAFSWLFGGTNGYNQAWGMESTDESGRSSSDPGG